MPEKIDWAHCNTCLRETVHDVVWQHPDFSEIEITMLRCRGCGDWVMRKEVWSGSVLDDVEREIVKTEYMPPRRWRGEPPWLDQLEELEPELKAILDEIYSAANDQQVRLLAMGVRAALDRVMVSILEGDVGSFDDKLDEMVAHEHLTKKQRRNMAIVIDAASASSHRGFRPDRTLLEEMVVVMEGLIREHYITGPMLETARTMIPPRPKPKPKVKP